MYGRKSLARALAVSALVTAASGASAASFNISNDFQGWLASIAANPVLGTGTFVADPQNPTIPVLSGLPGVTFTPNGGSVAFNSPNLTNTLTSGAFLEWTFDTPQSGWGGTFDIGSGTNNGIQFQANPGGTFVDVDFFTAGQTYNGFYGFSSDETFTAVRVIGAGFVSYNQRDVSIAAVPEPTTGALTGLGLASLAFFGRRGRARGNG